MNSRQKQEQKQKFLKLYLENGNNAKQACIDVGIRPELAATYGKRWRRLPEIKEQIEEYQAGLRKKYKVISKDAIIKKLVDIMNSDEERADVAIKSASLLCDILGYKSANKTDVTTNGYSVTVLALPTPQPKKE